MKAPSDRWDMGGTSTSCLIWPHIGSTCDECQIPFPPVSVCGGNQTLLDGSYYFRSVGLAYTRLLSTIALLFRHRDCDLWPWQCICYSSRSIGIWRFVWDESIVGETIDPAMWSNQAIGRSSLFDRTHKLVLPPFNKRCLSKFGCI